MLELVLLINRIENEYRKKPDGKLDDDALS
jgi:hypothetical protein